MPTRSIRDYGPIGAGSAAQDNATFKKAVAASKAGDTLTLPYDPAGHNTVRLASNTKLWNGGTLATDEGIEYRKSDATAGAIFDCSILRSFLFTIGSKNGKGAAIDPLAAGKWVVNVDKAVTKCSASSGIALFKTAQGIVFEDVAGIMNWSTITGGKASANQTNVALFRYPGVKTEHRPTGHHAAPSLGDSWPVRVRPDPSPVRCPVEVLRDLRPRREDASLGAGRERVEPHRRPGRGRRVESERRQRHLDQPARGLVA